MASLNSAALARSAKLYDRVKRVIPPPEWATFADRGRTGDAKSLHSISISYLGLAREDQVGQGFEAHWSGWYDYFPWEDHRAGPPALLVKMLTPRLRTWAKSAPAANLQR